MKPPLLKIVAGLVALLGLVALVKPEYIVFPVFWGIVSISNIGHDEGYLSQPDVYEPVGRTLALYCQSDPACLPYYLNVAWLPESLERFPESRGSADAIGA